MVPGRNGSVGLFHQHLTVGFLLYIYISIVDMKVTDWLVVWNMAFIFPYIYILGIIIPTDFHIFQRN